MLVGVGEWVRQDRQPLVQQCPDLPRAELIADPLQRGRVIDLRERVVQRHEREPGLGGLPLRPVVPVDAQLRVVREVGAELDEERTEIFIYAVKVEVVDHPGGVHDPRVGHTISVPTLLGPEQRGLLLRPADEHHPLLRGERGQLLVHDIVLALALHEVDPRDALGVGEPVHRRDEPVGDLGQRRSRGDRQPQLPVHIAHQARRVLQLRLIHIQIHPVDAFHLEPDVTGQDIGDTSRYGHHGLRTGRAASRPTNRYDGSYTPITPLTRVYSPGRSPTTQPSNGTPRRAGAKPL